jgi:hypothetical protein
MSSNMASFWAARGREKRLLSPQECLELEPALAALDQGDNRDLVGGILCEELTSALHVRDSLSTKQSNKAREFYYIYQLKYRFFKGFFTQ